MNFLKRLFRRFTTSTTGGAIIHFDGSDDFPLDVVGESNYQDILEGICSVRTQNGHDKRVNAILVYENSNRYDNKAVMLLINDRKVGYLTRVDARYYRRKMAKAGFAERPAKCAAKIVGGWDRGGDNKGHFDVKLDLPIKPIEKPNNYWLLLIIPLGLFGYVAVGPYITMRQIRVGIYEQDHETHECGLLIPSRSGIPPSYQGLVDRR